MLLCGVSKVAVLTSSSLLKDDDRTRVKVFGGDEDYTDERTNTGRCAQGLGTVVVEMNPVKL